MQKVLIFSVIMFIFFACEIKKEQPLEFVQVLEATKKQIVPDKRVALLQLETSWNDGKLVVSGETDQPQAEKLLAETLKKLEMDVVFKLKLLPDTALQGRTIALVNVSVANLRSKPEHSAELATQATLGTPLKVLKKQGTWYLIQTPDRYLSWVDAGALRLMNEPEMATYQKKTKVIYTSPYGFSYTNADSKSPTISDVVLGDVWEMAGVEKGFVKIVYPDARIAFLGQSDCMPLTDWLAQRQVTGDNLVASAKKMAGLPYLWGGTSFKGVDCSGFTKTAFFMNGLIIPRDASQQVHAGEAVDTKNGFEQLQAGDLLFFGKTATDSTAEKVVHVGMWIGNNEFIHASDYVRVNSMDKNSPLFDEFQLKRFLRAKRLTSPQNEKIKSIADVYAK